MIKIPMPAVKHVIRAVSFDAFGTIIMPKIPASQCYAKFALEKCGLELTAAEIEKSFFPVYKEHYKQFENFGVKDGLGPRLWWNRVVRQTFGLCLAQKRSTNVACQPATADFPIPLEKTDELYDWYATEEAWKAHPEAVSTLAQLAALSSDKGHLSLAVLSNFDERLPTILSILGLAAYLDSIVYSTAHEFMKPDLRLFSYLINELKLTHPKQLLHVGDCPDRDYIAAVKAGCSALFLNESAGQKYTVSFLRSDRSSRIDSGHIIHSLGQVVSFVKRVR